MKRRVFTSQLLSTGLLSTGLITTGFALPLSSIGGKQARAQALNNVLIAPTSPLTEPLIVFRSPLCGCCGAWVEHMEANGFHSQVRMAEDMDAIKQQYGIPEGLTSCHTGLIDGYLLEGHVPAEDVKRLLLERPDVAGLTVPEMPVGSPGMEQGGQIDPYIVFTFTKGGEVAPFARHT